MPLLGQQEPLARFLRSYAATLPRQPTAIVVATAHWETRRTTVSGAAKHSLLFDYGGFPAETYKYNYAAPGYPSLARHVKELLQEKNLPCELDERRGWDHGVFVPLKLMFPGAQVPVVALSLLDRQDAEAQIAVGEALQGLRNQGVLIIGSGVSFHNFSYFMAQGAALQQNVKRAAAWDDWLQETLTSKELSDTERRSRMAAWTNAPAAREAHPERQAEHLMPLFVVFGASGSGPAGRSVGDVESQSMMGFRVSQFEFA
eukprot:gnl/TRDRNA2_/TRDRNA2_165562_c3_seq2.p1 gnl/TRDRNA2_/TRDRNA2_165562_c3~~gnl/TRDRNA2_/TRDRNA2_165562_c3_seq2.p1  ORF type:complete len:259 (+),score=57.27 gnl/TRDRNA2_/TRDRNA2_165562_c3_seq2:2-778(+)